MSNFPRQL